MPTVSVRLPDEEKDELEAVADLLEEDWSTIIRKSLRDGLHDLRVRHAVERYQSGDVAVTEAARLANVTVAEWLEIAREKNLTVQFRREDLEREVEAAHEL
ncbi:hypothetical protein HLRTI_002929 [Halorhabdus tiamatea SARL4B]|uniref:Ribbon-helix-helix protein CopG domain-containing protein n=1 Tax=Halorhabdus tiamatea SARL4B TaxID=1033806 RepID=F7PNA6_9EURY|nr:UPF0175 family protein [Halorhabdus tiamatea]ERJ05057.1 hypothetical protein HLRTI_002929 [Halorhabdus tiamatea SARL4B]CCQ34580.1 conserved hypothetical protein (UPF0175) [Halorhabdus tiamatea SARL4B]